MARRAVLAIVTALALVAGGAWWWLHRAPSTIEWQGYAEGDFVKVGPTGPGQLAAVFVARGDEVAAGTPLFAQDDTQERAAHDQAQLQLSQLEQQLANLQAAGKPTEIEQAQANLAEAAAATRAEADFRRSETLAAAHPGAISTQTTDQTRADYLSAKAKVQAAQAALAQARAPIGRPREIDAQTASVAAARAALAETQWRLDQRHVAAPAAGRVADVISFAGEALAAGAPVVSILPPENIFVRFFVPEGALASLHRGDGVALRCDACPPDLSGTISFISPQAEYTPPVIYSEASRSKLVYLVEARLRPEQARLLNPGEPVVVRPADTRPQRAASDVPPRH